MSWEKIRWRDVLNIYNGKNQSKVVNPNGRYPIYGSGGLMGYSDDFLCPAETTIIGRKGSINNPIFVNTEFWNVDTAFGLVAKEGLLPKYLYYFCKTFNFLKLDKSTTLPSLTKSDLLEIEIPLPPLPIQEKIAAILDKADELRRKDQELLKKYDELAQAIFIDMFGDPVKNEKGWEVKRLGEVAMLQGGYAFKSKDFTNEGVRLVKITNVHNNTLIWDEVDFLPDEFLKKYNNFSLHAGDIVMAMTRPVIKSLNGIKVIRVYESDLPCLLNQRVGRFVFRDKIINGVFLYALCNTQYFKDKIEKLSSVSLQPNISSKQVENIEIFLPPITIQEAFTKKIELINQLKAQTNAEKSEELFQSLLQRAFRGDIMLKSFDYDIDFNL